MKSILITSSILIALIAVLRPILRGRIDPRMQYALWLVAALRLLAPVELAPSAYSALALLDRGSAPARMVEAIGQTYIPTQSYDSAHAQVIEEYRQQGVNTADLTPHDLMSIETQARERMKGPTLAEIAAKYAKPVWLTGAALMAAWFLLVNFRLRRKLRRAEPVEADCPLPVFVSDVLPSPCLCGTIRPKIYVTPGALTGSDRLRHVLAHELTHYRHRDHWWALVRCLCLCLYWFDPLVWWAAALSRQDCELACDAGAIRRLGEAERLSYGRTLVGMIAAGRCSLLQTATTMTGGKRRVKERVKLIARKPRTVIALALALVLILGLAVGCTFTGAPEPEDDSNPMSASRPGLPLGTLAERLADIPEELQPQVVNRGDLYNDTGVLADYWWDVPAEWEDPSAPWLLTVYQWDQARFEGWYFNIGHGNGGTGAFFEYEVFARDKEHYYVLCRPTAPRFEMEGSEDYTAAYNTIWDFAMETVLATEGLEPYDPDLTTPSPTVETLVERLLDVPVGWRDDIEAVQSDYSDAVCGDGLVEYWMNRNWTNMDNSGLGFLLRVYTLTQEEYQEEFVNQANYGAECFARSDGIYYIIGSPTDARYYTIEDEPDYFRAYDTIRAYAIKTVLETEGVESFDPYTTPPHFFSNVKQPPLAPGTYAIDGMDYTLVNSYQQVPEDPNQWYLAGYMPDIPVWMFTRGNGEETMFQIDDHLTQVFPYRARFYGGGFTHDGRAPQFRPLDGFAWGTKGTSGSFAVITHVFQGGTDQLYQLTVYDLDTDPVTSYVHDWKTLMNDFNSKSQVQLHSDTHSATVSYQGQSAEIQFDEAEWENVRQYSFPAQTYEYIMAYSFNSDGTFNLEMPINPFTTPYIAVWTLRFTGSGFETTGFRFVQADDVYLYISAPH